MWRILRIIVKPRKKFLPRIVLFFLILLIISVFCALFVDVFERFLIEVELRFSKSQSAQNQSIRYVYNSLTKSKRFLFKSKCDCRKWETISIEQINGQSNYSSNKTIKILKKKKKAGKSNLISLISSSLFNKHSKQYKTVVVSIEPRRVRIETFHLRPLFGP